MELTEWSQLTPLSHFKIEARIRALMGSRCALFSSSWRAWSYFPVVRTRAHFSTWSDLKSRKKEKKLREHEKFKQFYFFHGIFQHLKPVGNEIQTRYSRNLINCYTTWQGGRQVSLRQGLDLKFLAGNLIMSSEILKRKRWEWKDSWRMRSCHS